MQREMATTMSSQLYSSAATELYDFEDPGPNDVLFGRGTGSNMHSGNIRFRALIQKYKPVYRDTPKKMKPSVSTKVVAIWRSQDPPGRFLSRSDRFHGSRRTFYDVGDAAARRKAAQCLREKPSKERHTKTGDKRPLEEAPDKATSNINGGEGFSCSDPLGAWGANYSLEMFDASEQDHPASPLENKNDDIVSMHSDIVNHAPLPNYPQGVLEPSLKYDDQSSNALKLSDVASSEVPNLSTPKMDVPTSKQPLPAAFVKLGLPTTTGLQLDLPKRSDTSSTTVSTTKLDLPPSKPVMSLKLDVLHTLPLKTMVPSSKCKQQQEKAWLAAGSPKQDPMSLFDVYTSNKEDNNNNSSSESDRKGASDSPLLFASFDLGGSDKNNEEDGEGLCFPSLFGGGGDSSSATTSTLFGDSPFGDSSSPFGHCSSPFPGRSTPAASLPEVSPPAAKTQEALQTIRDSMPTAASLTTSGFFDW